MTRSASDRKGTLAMNRSSGTLTRSGGQMACAVNEYEMQIVRERDDTLPRAVCIDHESRTGGFALLPLEGVRSVLKDNAFGRDLDDHHEGDSRGYIKNGVIP
jgi:hypothetical protein